MKYIKFDSNKFNSNELRKYLVENNIKFYHTQSSNVYVFDGDTDDTIMYFLLKFNGKILTTEIEIQNALKSRD